METQERIYELVEMCNDPKLSEEIIIRVLTMDQCRHGFSHTREHLLYWLSHSTLDAMEELSIHILRHIADVKRCEAIT